MTKRKKQVSEGGIKIFSVSALVLFLVMGFCADISAQTPQSGKATLRGFVIERGTANTPVEFATIQVLPQGSVATTGRNGEFMMEKLSPGKVNVKINFLGMEPVDTTFILPAGKVTELTFSMQYSSFRLTEVSVVATESKAGQATASNISRQAMDHLQASSLSDVMQLMPGGVIANPNLSTAKTFTIRSVDNGATGSSMNSLGTTIYMDGSPLSNNANMQALSPSITGSAVAVGGGSNPNSGFDIRSISTDNIESIEVIRGIPSVEYGDLTSGAVIVRSKAGREPLTVRFKTDPSIYQASVSKGINLGAKKGNLNVSADYAYSTTELTESYVYYQRVTAKALYSNVFKNLVSNSSFDFTMGKDTRELNPNDARSQLFSGAQEYGFRLNTNGTWNINKGWLNNINYTVSGNYTDKHSYRSELLGNAFAGYSMSETDGAILSNKAGQKVYDINGNEITNIPVSESGYYATVLPNEYTSRYDIYGKELNLFAKLKATFSKSIGNVSNRIVVGADFRSDGNLGDGKIYDLANPPYRNLSSENSSPRPRKYSDIPFVTQYGLYAEENMTWSLGKRDIFLQLGGRFDNVEGKSIVAPRINASIEVIPEKLFIRGGHGVNAKAPTTLYLYPQNAYFDFVHYNTLNSSIVPANEQLLLISTRSFNTENPDLKIASNRKNEIGFDLKINKMRFSVTAFDEKLKNGYNLGNSVDNFNLINYIQYEVGQSNAGAIPTLKEKARSNIFVSYATPMNNIRSHNRGVEFDFDLGRFDKIRTSFVLNGAYIRTTGWNAGSTFGTNDNGNNLEKNIAIYEPANSKDERERFTTTLRATHNIPSIGFVLTATAQVNWINKTWTNYGNDSIFVSYISYEDGQVHNLTQTQMNELANKQGSTYDELEYMLNAKSAVRHIAESYFPTFTFNLNLTKEIGDLMKASFYVNNMFNTRPKYEKKQSPGSYVRLNVPIYFGFEFTVTIK
ncbi:MAG: TonB-dependent receptor [Bacteroidales bacterium]|nr:TonB-dependent receptor [Bacteroidales bacterium]